VNPNKETKSWHRVREMKRSKRTKMLKKTTLLKAAVRTPAQIQVPVKAKKKIPNPKRMNDPKRINSLRKVKRWNGKSKLTTLPTYPLSSTIMKTSKNPNLQEETEDSMMEHSTISIPNSL
jgi:hypothetical protein